MSYPMLAVVVYVAGVAWGLMMVDARPIERMVLALLWPLGPLAFAVTVSILLAVSLIVYPTIMVPAAIAVAALWWTIA